MSEMERTDPSDTFLHTCELRPQRYAWNTYMYHAYTTHIPRMYHACTTHVPRMYHVCTTHIPRIYHACTTHVPRIYHAYTTHIPRMYHAYTTHIPRMYHACAPNNTNKKFFVTECALVQVLNLSTPGIGEHNYCRQPELPLANVDDTPWCYTTSSTRWEYCDVPACSEYNTRY